MQSLFEIGTILADYQMENYLIFEIIHFQVEEGIIATAEKEFHRDMLKLIESIFLAFRRGRCTNTMANKYYSDGQTEDAVNNFPVVLPLLDFDRANQFLTQNRFLQKCNRIVMGA